MIKRRKREKMDLREETRVRSPRHLRFVRLHECAAGRQCGLGFAGPIEAAHVRLGTDGGTGIKPGDNWAIPLCPYHHRQQHAMGENTFEREYKIDMKKTAADLWARSPHRLRYEQKKRRQSC